MKTNKTATEAMLEEKKDIHLRRPDNVLTADCLKHDGLCIYVWCEKHQIYEHAMEILT